MSEIIAKKILVSGWVQGVFFRDFSRRRAKELNLAGYAKNLSDGASVEILAQGEKENIEKFINWLKTKGPPFARIKSIKVENWEINPSLKDFEIH